MKNRRRTLISLSLALAATASLFAVQNLQIREILGEKYYVYEIKKGDSLFGIARSLNWSDSIIQALNPGAVSPMKKGAKIYYPVAASAVADTVETPVSAPRANLPIRHTVQKGETVYSISKLYNIPVTAIYNLNPSAREGVTPGQQLTLQTVREAVTKDDRNFSYYKVKSGDTLYGLAKENGITVESILKANPGISESNFKADAVIKLPPRGSGVVIVNDTTTRETVGRFDTYQVGKNETWASIAAANGMQEQLLQQANSIKQPKSKKYIVIPRLRLDTVVSRVVRVDPREFTQEGIQEIYEDVHAIADSAMHPAVNYAIVLDEPTSKKDLEFVRGAVTAIDRLKGAPYRINLKVIDSRKGAEEVTAELAAFKPSAIVSTADKNLPDYLVRYSTENATPLVNTFDVKSEAFNDNPYVVHLLTPSNYFNDEVTEWVKNRYDGYTLVMAGEKDSADSMGEALMKAWTPGKVVGVSTEALPTLQFLPANSYLLYCWPVKKAEVATLLEKIGEAREANPGAVIEVLGRPNWVVFDESLSKELHAANVTLPSRFYYDPASPEARGFASAFNSVFRRTPQKSIPLFAGVGYDATNYFIRSIARTGGDLNEFKPSNSTVQSVFELTRPTNWSGFFNPAVLMLRFSPAGSVEKTLVN